MDQGYSFSNAMRAGWSTFKRQYAVLVGMSLVYVLIVSVVGGIGHGMLRAFGFNFVSPIANFLVFPQLLAGLTLAGAAAVRGRKLELADMFDGFQRIWSIAGISFFLTIMSIGIMLPVGVLTILIIAMGGGGGPWLGVIIGGFIAAMLVIMFVALRFSLAQLILVDPMMPRVDLFTAMRLSWRRTSAVWLSLAGLGFVLGLLIMVSALMLVLPALLLAVPLSLAVWGAAYAMLVHPDGTCLWCGYDLSGSGANPTRCPECGGALTRGHEPPEDVNSRGDADPEA